ncbi:MAG TPA: hypothetical protein PKK96_01190 [Anaerolineales bacterium]|nr:hypothetical protein [Anaerolineales bacterium]HMR97754.1 hypothetical protein [Anaerolineales bacterium]HNQ93451.1 hypothetical protein [Anaerolineales bacterium]HNS59590.1 hypothetical protein [Anaerolineales bacterium]
MENKLMFIGALGAFFLATVATLVSDMHGIGDWFISSLQSRKYALNPAPIYGAPYTIAGYFGEPLLILSITMLTVGLYGSWLKHHKTIALIAMVIGILYISERIFWSYVTINFANHIQIHSTIQNYAALTQAGFLKGLGALFGGLIGGFGFSTALTILFLSLRNPYGIAGGVIVLVAMLIGMPAKIYFMNHVSTTVLTIFILSMVIKNFGVIFMGMGLLMESFK